MRRIVIASSLVFIVACGGKSPTSPKSHGFSVHANCLGGGWHRIFIESNIQGENPDGNVCHLGSISGPVVGWPSDTLSDSVFLPFVDFNDNHFIVACQLRGTETDCRGKWIPCAIATLTPPQPTPSSGCYNCGGSLTPTPKPSIAPPVTTSTCGPVAVTMFPGPMTVPINTQVVIAYGSIGARQCVISGGGTTGNNGSTVGWTSGGGLPPLGVYVTPPLTQSQYIVIVCNCEIDVKQQDFLVTIF